jgi:hypothetical protein
MISLQVAYYLRLKSKIVKAISIIEQEENNQINSRGFDRSIYKKITAIITNPNIRHILSRVFKRYFRDYTFKQ